MGPSAAPRPRTQRSRPRTCIRTPALVSFIPHARSSRSKVRVLESGANGEANLGRGSPSCTVCDDEDEANAERIFGSDQSVLMSLDSAILNGEPSSSGRALMGRANADAGVGIGATPSEISAALTSRATTATDAHSVTSRAPSESGSTRAAAHAMYTIAPSGNPDLDEHSAGIFFTRQGLPAGPER